MLSPRIPIPIGSDVYRAGGGGVYVVGYSGNFVSQLQFVEPANGYRGFPELRAEQIARNGCRAIAIAGVICG